MIDWTFVEESTQQLQALLDRVKKAARKADIDATTQAFNKFAIATAWARQLIGAGI